jgi:hypothetical protein
MGKGETAREDDCLLGSLVEVVVDYTELARGCFGVLLHVVDSKKVPVMGCERVAEDSWHTRTHLAVLVFVGRMIVNPPEVLLLETVAMVDVAEVEDVAVTVRLAAAK